MSGIQIQLVNKVLEKQIKEYIAQLEAYNNVSPKERRRSKKDYIFLKDFFTRFFIDRNKRSVEVLTPRYKKVAELARSQFPLSTYWNLCMDGRVKTVLTNGVTAGIGSSIRVPGGILREFIRGTDGRFKLLKKSNFAMLLLNALSSDDVIVEVFDSHVGCAARSVEEEARGRSLSDSGLLSDVLHKKEMLVSVYEFVQEAFGSRKRVIGIQTSFDPHEGFLYMGLETDEAINVAKEFAEKKNSDWGSIQRWEYEPEVLEGLVASGKVISTKQLANESTIARVFRKYAYSTNWPIDYVGSAEQFWNNMAVMKHEVFPIIKEKIYSVYPQLKKKGNDTQELEGRAMLLLSSAYISYVHTLSGEYPYSEHREECIKISRGGYPPYDISAFVVLGSDEKNLAANIELAAFLVRKNRRDGRAVDRADIFHDKGIFAQAPMPLIVQEIMDESLEQKEWDFLTLVDWSDLPSNWDELTDREFFSYLEIKGNIHIKAAIALNNLRRTMAVLFDPDQVTAGRLVSHHKVAIPVMVDKNRINYFIVPFVKLGFS